MPRFGALALMRPFSLNTRDAFIPSAPLRRPVSPLASSRRTGGSVSAGTPCFSTPRDISDGASASVEFHQTNTRIRSQNQFPARRARGLGGRHARERVEPRHARVAERDAADLAPSLCAVASTYLRAHRAPRVRLQRHEHMVQQLGLAQRAVRRVERRERRRTRPVLHLVQRAHERAHRTGRECSHVRVVLAQTRASQSRRDDHRKLVARLAQRRRLLRRGTERFH